MRLLLISNSTMSGEEYLRYPMPEIKKFPGNQPLNAVFYKIISPTGIFYLPGIFFLSDMWIKREYLY
jgi:hypothetical protein